MMRFTFERSDVVRTAMMSFDVVAMWFDVDRANIGRVRSGSRDDGESDR